MRKVLYGLLLIAGVILLHAGFSVSAQESRPSGRPPVVHTRFAPDTILIGDQFQMVLEIEKDVSQEIHLPHFENNQMTPQIEVISIDGVDTLDREGRRMKIRVNYRMTSFDEGTHPVAGFPVVWSDGTEDGKQDTVLAPEVMRLTVQTFDIDTTKQTIFDIKRPQNTPLIFDEIKELVLYSLLGALVLSAVIYWLIRYIRQRRGRVRPKKLVPPHVLAIRSLEKLHSKKLWQNGKHKEYYSTLADIVRVYIERTYGINAMEMTSDQILTALEEINEERLRAKLREMFGLADLVKFAKMTPSPEDNEQAYFDAYFYVEETKAVEPESLPGAASVEDVKEIQ